MSQDSTASMLSSPSPRRRSRNAGSRSSASCRAWRSRSAYRSSTWILQPMRSPRKAMFAPTTGPRSTSSAAGRANRNDRNWPSVLLEQLSAVAFNRGSGADELAERRHRHRDGHLQLRLERDDVAVLGHGRLLALHVDAAAEVRAVGDGDAGRDDV